MGSLRDRQGSKLLKLMYIGDSSTGKTGSLVSLVKAGYKLRILDMDNGLDALEQEIGHQCPELLDNVDAITLRDTIRATGNPGNPTRNSADAYSKAMKIMNTWDDESSPAEWGPDTIFVLDSLTHLGRAAFAWARSMSPSVKDPRQWFYSAQQSVETVLGMLTSDAFATNVIIITHINYKEVGDAVDKGEKGYPSAIGSALGPIIASYFNIMIQAESTGTGKSLRRSIRVFPSPTVDLKVPAPFKFDDRALDLNTGLAEVFEKLKTL